jgi:hypothetical protein
MESCSSRSPWQFVHSLRKPLVDDRSDLILTPLD